MRVSVCVYRIISKLRLILAGLMLDFAYCLLILFFFSFLKQARVHLLDNAPFADAFGPKAKRKRPKLMALDYDSLAKKAEVSQGMN